MEHSRLVDDDNTITMNHQVKVLTLEATSETTRNVGEVDDETTI
jgi:hypothetical protein